MKSQYHEQSGYCDCACGTCFDIAIASVGDTVGEVLCSECFEAGCEPDEECYRDIEDEE